jgi:DNA invertase Pin-like site-specific DNA recombinase
MNKNPRGLFYTRDSGGKAEQTPGEYVLWAKRRAKDFGLVFDGCPEEIEAMIRSGRSTSGDIFLDYSVAGNQLKRKGLDALIKTATTDELVTHVFIPRRDRLARPDDPIDGIKIETLFRKSGVTLVFMNKVCPPLTKGKRQDIGDLIVSMLDYNYAGEFRRELAQKILFAQIGLAKAGFSTGGRPPYGFRRWLAKEDGTPVRELVEGERVRMAGHRVVWLPGPDEELSVIRRIIDMLPTMPATQVAKALTAEGVATPDAGRYRTDNAVRHLTSGVWHQTTIINIARNPLLIAVATYGHRSMGDQMRFTPEGPRELRDSDFRADEAPKVIRNPEDHRITAEAKFSPVVDPKKRDELIAILDSRAGTQRGKPRSQDPSRNPLGSRVFDMNCSWPMYRVPYQEAFKYKCGLYQQSHGEKCAHNHVDGPAATQFLLSCVRQRLLSPNLLPKLEARIRKLATAVEPTDQAEHETATKRRAIEDVDTEIAKVSRNLALADNPDQFKAIASVFEQLKEKQSRLQVELEEAESHEPVASDIEAEIAQTMAVAEQLTELATREGSLETARQIFSLTNARLFLQFKTVQVKKRVLNKISGGVVTFGDAEPPISIYEGPTSRSRIKSEKKPAPGGTDPSGPDFCVVSGQEDRSLGNVSRGDRI